MEITQIIVSDVESYEYSVNAIDQRFLRAISKNVKYYMEQFTVHQVPSCLQKEFRLCKYSFRIAWYLLLLVLDMKCEHTA